MPSPARSRPSRARGPRRRGLVLLGRRGGWYGWQRPGRISRSSRAHRGDRTRGLDSMQDASDRPCAGALAHENPFVNENSAQCGAAHRLRSSFGPRCLVGPALDTRNGPATPPRHVSHPHWRDLVRIGPRQVATPRRPGWPCRRADLIAQVRQGAATAPLVGLIRPDGGGRRNAACDSGLRNGPPEAQPGEQADQALLASPLSGAHRKPTRFDRHRSSKRHRLRQEAVASDPRTPRQGTAAFGTREATGRSSSRCR